MVLLSVLFLSVTTGQFRGWHIDQVLAFGLTAVVLAYFSPRASRPEWLAAGVLAADEARRSTATALKMLNSWFAQPARVVPVLAQHRRAVVQTVKAVDDTLGTISSEVALVDLSSLEPKRGRFNTQSIIGSQLPMEQIVAALVELQRSVEDVDSPWLVPPARSYLQEFSVELDDAVRQGQQTLVALRMAPPLLGANGKRTYFVAFTTPSEIRGSLGFMGNWAEFTADNGQILMTRFGRSVELNDGGNAPRRVTAPPDWMRGWAPYGFNTGEGSTAQREV